MPRKPFAIIVGPAEQIKGGDYMPRALAPPCEDADPKVPGGTRYTKEQCEAVLDEMERASRARGWRVIRVHTMQERDAILTFVRQAVDRMASKLAGSLGVYGHEDEVA